MILFEEGWDKYAMNHLKSKALARGLIRNAAVALRRKYGHDYVMFWIHAALGGAGVLNVLKGLNQPKGIFDEVTHIRMRLFIEDSKKGALKYPNTTFATDFHLYSTVLNPEDHPENQQLQPTRLTYKTVWHDPIDARYIEIAIVGADVLTNNFEIGSLSHTQGAGVILPLYPPASASWRKAATTAASQTAMRPARE